MKRIFTKTNLLIALAVIVLAGGAVLFLSNSSDGGLDNAADEGFDFDNMIASPTAWKHPRRLSRLLATPCQHCYQNLRQRQIQRIAIFRRRQV